MSFDSMSLFSKLRTTSKPILLLATLALAA
ncbi:MAG: hypothetical protein RLZZ457_649, partial [Pseudomonadota bacterium]